MQGAGGQNSGIFLPRTAWLGARAFPRNWEIFFLVPRKRRPRTESAEPDSAIRKMTGYGTAAGQDGMTTSDPTGDIAATSPHVAEVPEPDTSYY